MNARKSITQKFRNIIDYIHEIDKVLYISMRGIASFSKLPNLIEALIDLDCSVEKRVMLENENEELENAKSMAQFAEKEIAEEFPILHAHSVVAIWSAVETLIEDFAILWILNERESIDKEILQKISIPLLEYEELGEQERAIFIYRVIEEKTRLKYIPGIARYEKIMNIFGIGGSVPENIKNDLFEMNNVRNVIVHRSSIADRRLIESCPRMDINLGEKVKIKHNDYMRYITAMYEYMTLMVYRIKDYYDKKENIVVQESL